MSGCLVPSPVLSVAPTGTVLITLGWGVGGSGLKPSRPDQNILMGVDELLSDKRDAILQIAAQHGARNVRVFGSVARGEARPDSDIDFLVDSGPGRTPFFPGGLLADLEDLLGRRVQVLTEPALHPRIRARVLQEAVRL